VITTAVIPLGPVRRHERGIHRLEHIQSPFVLVLLRPDLAVLGFLVAEPSGRSKERISLPRRLLERTVPT